MIQQSLGIQPKDLKAGCCRDICTYMSIAVLFTIAKRSKQPVSIKGKIDKQNVVYTYNEILFSLKNEGNCDT